MTAERDLMDKWRRGEAITPLDHITTIDSADELAAFMDALNANGRITDEIRVAAMRREIQIRAALTGSPASRP